MGDVVILPVVRHESAGLREQEAKRARLWETKYPERDDIEAAVERARRRKADDEAEEVDWPADV